MDMDGEALISPRDRSLDEGSSSCLDCRQAGGVANECAGVWDRMEQSW